MDPINQEMHARAKAVRANAYAPYSNFSVGACIRTEDDTLIAGCNVENAAYPLAQCAEGAAVTAMVAAGYKKIKSIAVIGSEDKLTPPCGGCRQKILEFANDDAQVFLCDDNGIVKTVTIGELIPLSFNQLNLARD